MKRIPESGLPKTRHTLPEGCSDLIQAYELRSEAEQQYERHILSICAQLHDPFIEQLDLTILQSEEYSLLRAKISDFLHPILLENKQLAQQILSSSDFVDMFLHVVIANYDEQ